MFSRNQQAYADAIQNADLRWVLVIPLYWCELVIVRVNR